jgi:hypothetical protein
MPVVPGEYAGPGSLNELLGIFGSGVRVSVMGDAGENTSLEKVNQVVLNEHGCNKIFSFLCSYVIL